MPDSAKADSLKSISIYTNLQNTCQFVILLFQDKHTVKQYKHRYLTDNKPEHNEKCTCKFSQDWTVLMTPGKLLHKKKM